MGTNKGNLSQKIVAFVTKMIIFVAVQVKSVIFWLLVCVVKPPVAKMCGFFNALSLVNP